MSSNARVTPNGKHLQRKKSSKGYGYMNTATLAPTTERPDETPAETLSETLRSKLSNPASTSDFDLFGSVSQVLKDVGLTPADSGGKLTFYGQDPILPSSFRFGAMAAVGLATRGIALAALWRSQTGEGQDIHVDVR